jgi:hypothetical protein
VGCKSEEVHPEFLQERRFDIPVLINLTGMFEEGPPRSGHKTWLAALLSRLA